MEQHPTAPCGMHLYTFGKPIFIADVSPDLQAAERSLTSVKIQLSNSENSRPYGLHFKSSTRHHKKTTDFVVQGLCNLNYHNNNLRDSFTPC